MSHVKRKVLRPRYSIKGYNSPVFGLTKKEIAEFQQRIEQIYAERTRSRRAN